MYPTVIFERPVVTIPDVVNMVICAGGVPVFVDFEKKTTFLNFDH